jgi:glutathione S-transferase
MLKPTLLKLWGRKTSSNVMKVLWTLDESASYERIDVGGTFGGTGTPNIAPKQPMGLVPAIEEPDGFTLFESNAIIKDLCNAHAHAPSSALDPADARTRGEIDAWMDLQQTALSAPAGTFFIGLVRMPAESAT